MTRLVSSRQASPGWLQPRRPQRQQRRQRRLQTLWRRQPRRTQHKELTSPWWAHKWATARATIAQHNMATHSLLPRDVTSVPPCWPLPLPSASCVSCFCRQTGPCSTLMQVALSPCSMIATAALACQWAVAMHFGSCLWRLLDYVILARASVKGVST